MNGRGTEPVARLTTSRWVTSAGHENARRAALPVSAGDRKRFDSGSGGVVGLIWVCLGLLPAPIAAGSTSGRMGQGPGGSPAGVAGAVGVLDAAARERIMPGGGGQGAEVCGGWRLAVRGAGLPVRVTLPLIGRGRRRGSQPYLGARGLCAAPATR